MFILAHTGLSYEVQKRLKQSAPYWLIALIALAPDLIDKPLRYIIAPEFTRGCTRTIGHSLVFNTLLICVIAAAFYKKPKLRNVLILLVPLHLVLDFMWVEGMRVVAFWPFLGNHFPEPEFTTFWEHISHIFKKLSTILGEIVGGYLLWKRGVLKKFW